MAKFSDRTNALLDILSDRPIAYHPALAKIVGGAKAAIWVSQMLYWDGKGKKRGGWIYKTRQDWQGETGLTRTEQETVRRKLISRGLMEEEKRGVPCTLHYRLNYEALIDRAVETQQSSLQEPCNLDCGNPANKIAETLQSIPEITQETTTETTTEKPRDFLSEEFPLEPKPLETPTDQHMTRLREKFGTDPLGAMVIAAEQAKINDRPKGWEFTRDDSFAVCQRVADLWALGMLPSGTWGDRIEKAAAGAAELLRYHKGDLQAALLTLDRYHLHYGEQALAFTVAGPQSLLNVIPSFMGSGARKQKSGRQRKPGQRKGRREYEPSTDEEREVAWDLYGDALLAFIEDRGTDINLSAVTTAIANALGIDNRMAQAVRVAYAAQKMQAEEPVFDPATFFDE